MGILLGDLGGRYALTRLLMKGRKRGRDGKRLLMSATETGVMGTEYGRRAAFYFLRNRHTFSIMACLAESFTFILGLKDLLTKGITHHTYKQFQLFIEDYLT